MAGRCTHEAASIDQGPIAITTASASMGTPFDVDASYPRSIRTSDHACDQSRAQFGAMTLRRAHDRGCELAWVNNRCRFRRAESMGDKDALGKPIEFG